MPKLMAWICIGIFLASFASPAMARDTRWSVRIKKNYRNGYGDNTLVLVFCCKETFGRSTMLDEDVCAVTANGKKICKEVESSKRVQKGDCLVKTVKFKRTKYPIERVYID